MTDKDIEKLKEQLKELLQERYSELIRFNEYTKARMLKLFTEDMLGIVLE